MKRIMSTALFFLLLNGVATAQSGKERREAAEKKAAEERLRSPGRQRTPNELKDDRNEVRTRANTRGGDSATVNQQIGTVENSSGLADNEAQADSANDESNVPAIIQITTSESGSPSQLSENNGRGRDGTGNVQRATPNMAGSPVPSNLELADDDQGQRNLKTNTEVRKNEEQPQRVGPNRSETGAKGKGQLERENQQQVKETSKDKDQGDRKSRRKARRNRDKDSGN